jgi:hypothetical protein
MEAHWDTPRSGVVAHVAVVDGEAAAPPLPPAPGSEHQGPPRLNGCLKHNRNQTWSSVVQIIMEQAAGLGYRRAEAEHSQGPGGR